MSGGPADLRAIVEALAEEFHELEDPPTTQDVEAVLQALVDHVPLHDPPVALTPERWKALSREAVRDLPKAEQARDRWRRERLALATLFTLADRGEVQLTGPVHLSGMPRRRILDPLDPDLRLPSDHHTWQQALVQRLGEATQRRELAWEAAAGLLLFGGPCGEEAFRWIWSLRRGDYDATSGLMRFRHPRTEQTALAWYAHPVQQLTLARLIRARPPRSSTVFPQGLRRPEAQFLPWLQALTAPTPPQSLRQITITTARWMLELYPPFLVALASGRFQAADVDDARRPKGQRPVKPFPPSPGERQLRQACRKTLLRWLQRRFSKAARDAFLRAWEQLRRQGVTPGSWTTVPRIRRDHLRRLMKAVARRAMQTDRGKTILQIWDVGCMLIDRLGPQPIMHVNRTQLRQLCLGDAPATKEALRVVFTRMRDAGASTFSRASAVFPRARGAVRGRPPERIPDLDTYERIRSEAREGRSYTGATLQLYIDLLTLGVRKEEALHLRVGDVDPEGEAEALVEGTKTRAAHRRLGLWRHPNRAAVERLVAVVKARRGTDPADRHLLLDRSGQPFLRYKDPDRQADTVVDSLDHGVAEAARRTRLPAGVSPHALRHASVSLYIRSGLPLEWASQAHGHVELLTTLEHYVHSAAERQRALMEAASAGGRDLWLPLALARRFLGVSKQAVYRRARRAPDSVRTVSSLSPEALRRGVGRDARYVSASSLAKILQAGAKGT